jgi:hypothetical protein
LPAVTLRGRSLRGPLDEAGLRRLFAADTVWSIAAGLASSSRSPHALVVFGVTVAVAIRVGAWAVKGLTRTVLASAGVGA